MVTWFLLVLFLLIIMIGINNTYRMIIRERTREIGTMRAIGLQKSGIIKLFLTESGLLAFAGSITGLLLGIIGLQILSTLDFSGIALAAMFLQGGHLAWYLSPGLASAALLVMLIASVSGALGPARVAAALSPVTALSQGTK